MGNGLRCRSPKGDITCNPPLSVENNHTRCERVLSRGTDSRFGAKSMAATFVNNRMMNIRRDVTQMAYGVVELNLRGFTLASINPGLISDDGRGNFRAECRKCGGTGVPIMEYEEMKEDVNGRGKEFCFACQGRGEFLMVKPEVYLRLIQLWTYDMIKARQWDQILRVCESEIEYMNHRANAASQQEWEGGEGLWFQTVGMWWFEVRRKGEFNELDTSIAPEAVKAVWSRMDATRQQTQAKAQVRKQLASQGMPEGWIEVLLRSHMGV